MTPDHDPAREALESERAELVAYIASRRQYQIDPDLRDDLITRVQSLRRLAAQDQKPVAWRYTCHDGSEILLPERLTDKQKSRGYYTGIDGEDEVEGDEALIGPFFWTNETPLYLSPPPAAGWDQALRPFAACVFDDNGDITLDTSHLRKADYVAARDYFRHNAPPDTGAGEPEPLNCDFMRSFPDGTADNSTYGKIEDELDKIEAPFKDANGKWLSLHERIAAIPLPPHGGADAGVKAQIATLARRFWTIHPRELQDKGMTREDFYIREMTALVATISKPAPMAANASAEQWATELPDGSVSFDAYAGWSRDQLKDRCLELVGRIERLEEAANASAEARSLCSCKSSQRGGKHMAWCPHPHASVCDKQGER